jgi:hypothetical protein
MTATHRASTGSDDLSCHTTCIAVAVAKGTTKDITATTDIVVVVVPLVVAATIPPISTFTVV